MQILKKKDCISLAGVFARRLVISFLVLAGEWVIEQVTVVVLSVRIACQTEQTRNRNDQNCRTVEWVNITMEGSDRISYQSVASDR